MNVTEFKELRRLYTGLQVQQNQNNHQQTSNIFDEMKKNVETPQSPDHLK